MRQRRSGHLSVNTWRSLASLRASSSASPATPARLAAHELVDMSLVARAEHAEQEASKRGRKTKSKWVSIPKGRCAFAECPTLAEDYSGPLPVRPTTRCNACREGKGAYFHLPCFFECHSCGGSSNPRHVAADTPGS